MTDMFDGKRVKPMLIGESREAFDSPEFINELKSGWILTWSAGSDTSKRHRADA